MHPQIATWNFASRGPARFGFFMNLSRFDDGLSTVYRACEYTTLQDKEEG